MMSVVFIKAVLAWRMDLQVETRREKSDYDKKRNDY